VPRIVISALVIVGALALLGDALATIGKGKHSGEINLTHQPFRSTSSRSGTVPLRRRAAVGNGWTLKVTAATLHAFQLLGSSPKKTAPGGQDAMVFLSLGYSGAGYGRFGRLLKRLYVEGSGASVFYLPDSGDLNCTAARGAPSARPLNEKRTLVFPGHKVRGHLCFFVSHRDAKTLALYVDKPGCNTARHGDDNCQDRWRFALRR
jgi:hypothetical protein